MCHCRLTADTKQFWTCKQLSFVTFICDCFCISERTQMMEAVENWHCRERLRQLGLMSLENIQCY